LNSELYVENNTRIDGTLDVSSAVILENKLDTYGDASFGSNVFVSGDVSFGSQLYVENNAIIDGSLTVIGITTNQVVYQF
jgi:predicted acyltransferase (DUF342 family)